MAIKARDIAREEEAEGRPVGSKGGSVFCHRRLHLGPSLSLSLSLSLRPFFTRLRKEVWKEEEKLITIKGKADRGRERSSLTDSLSVRACFFIMLQTATFFFSEDNEVPSWTFLTGCCNIFGHF